MEHSQKKTKLHFEHLLLNLYQLNQQETVQEKMDYYPLLEEMSVFYNLTTEELQTRGFRKAYRRVVEGL
jgi:SPX domain protein involved in polyphosphate accumulation